MEIVAVITVAALMTVPCGDIVVTTAPLFQLMTGVCATPVVVSTERVTFPFGAEVTPFVSCFPSLKISTRISWEDPSIFQNDACTIPVAFSTL